MSHSEICPVCNKTGKYEEEICHGCGGLGWITITVHDLPYSPILPQYPCPSPRKPFRDLPWVTRLLGRSG